MIERGEERRGGGGSLALVKLPERANEFLDGCVVFWIFIDFGGQRPIKTTTKLSYRGHGWRRWRLVAPLASRIWTQLGQALTCEYVFIDT